MGVVFLGNNSFFQKPLHPSRQLPGSPLYKGFLDFHPSLHLSRHPSHISPVYTPATLPCRTLKREGYGRDMGEIKKIPPVLKPLCTKAFRKI